MEGGVTAAQVYDIGKRRNVLTEKKSNYTPLCQLTFAWLADVPRASMRTHKTPGHLTAYLHGLRNAMEEVAEMLALDLMMYFHRSIDSFPLPHLSLFPFPASPPFSP